MCTAITGGIMNEQDAVALVRHHIPPGLRKQCFENTKRAQYAEVSQRL